MKKKGKYLKKKEFKILRKNSFGIACLSLILLISLTAGIVAYFTSKDAKNNVFTPGVVSCEIKESFNGNVKSNVAVKNTGNVAAYIRSFIVINWVDDEGNVYGGEAPKEGEHYELELGTAWKKGKDGFYYCESIVVPGDLTPDLIVQCVEIKDSSPAGYSLSVEIVSSAVQADPNKTLDFWGTLVQ